jgi:hypothetical protein
LTTVTVQEGRKLSPFAVGQRKNIAYLCLGGSCLIGLCNLRRGAHGWIARGGFFGRFLCGQFFVITFGRVDHFPVVPADFFLGLIFSEDLHGAWLCAAAGDPIVPAEFAFRSLVLAAQAAAASTLAVTASFATAGLVVALFAAAAFAVFAAATAMARDANLRALAAVAHGSVLRGLANKLANFAASRPRAAAYEKVVRPHLRNRAHAKQQRRYRGP